jgi:hypothetical protein
MKDKKDSSGKYPGWIELGEEIRILDTVVFTATQSGRPILVFPKDISDDKLEKVVDYLYDEGWIDDLMDEDDGDDEDGKV